MVNVPNLLSVTRVLSVPLIIILMMKEMYGWALLVFVAAAVTDAIDGALARFLKQRTVLGSYLDPAADKLLSTACFLTLAILGLLPGWLAVVVISRDVMIALGIMILSWTVHPLVIRPSMVGKLTTAFQFLLVPAALLFRVVPPVAFAMEILVWGTALLTIVSGVQYMGRGIKILSGPPR